MWRLLLGTMEVKSLVQGLNAAATAGFEPRTVWSEVRRRNRLATAPSLFSAGWSRKYRKFPHYNDPNPPDYVPSGKWKKMHVLTKARCIQYAIFRDLPHWQDRFHVFTRTICHGRFFFVLNVVQYSLFVRWNRLSGHRGLENVLENWNQDWQAVDVMVVIRKKWTKGRAKKCSWSENWYVISDFVPRSVRLIQ